MMVTRSKHVVSESTYRFLNGPGKIWDNLIFCLKGMFSFLKGLRTLGSCGPSICVIGSAGHQKAANYYHKCAEEIGAIIANVGFTTITANGSGLMVAVNKGAFNSGGYSVSCNIKQPYEQGNNQYLHAEVKVPYFFMRNALMIKHSHACIVMPGSIDTLDGLFEVLNFTQVVKLKAFPVIVFGKEFYAPIKKQIVTMQTAGILQINEPANLFFTNSLDEVEYILQEYVGKHARLNEKSRTK